MPNLIVITPGARVGLHGERLKVEIPPLDREEESAPEVREIPLHEIEQVVVSEVVALTMPALAECLRREIPVLITAYGERLLGLCLPPAPHSAARVAQYERTRDPEFNLALASAFIEAKVMNSRRVLQRLAANRDGRDVKPALHRLEQIAEHVRQARSLDTLRGYEGTAAGLYFETFGEFFPAAAPFERRSRRPPHNAANAILSYTYTLLAAEMEYACHSAGLDPALGFYHEIQDRRPSLALDLIEPFRAPVADALALDLLSHGTLHPQEHFEKRDGGVFLNPSGKKRFFVAFERRMTRDFQGRAGVRTQLRAELRRMALEIKAAVLNGDMPEPFLMN
jgi:CRISPR-associated endonuclease Cas1